MKPQQQIQNAGKYPQKSGKNSQEEAGLSNYLFGKVQPQAVPLEEAVLGALMLDRDALPVVMDILRPETFYLESHQVIYRSIIRLFERSNPVDLLTVTEELRKSGELDKAGGGYYLVELGHRIASAANIEYHARIIAQKHIQRELIRVSTQTIQYAYEDTIDVFNLLDMTEKERGTYRYSIRIYRPRPPDFRLAKFRPHHYSREARHGQVVDGAGLRLECGKRL